MMSVLHILEVAMMSIKRKFLFFTVVVLIAGLWWLLWPLSDVQNVGLFAEFLERRAAAPQIAPAQKEHGLEAIFAIAGLLAVAFLVLRQRK